MRPRRAGRRPPFATMLLLAALQPGAALGQARVDNIAPEPLAIGQTVMIYRPGGQPVPCARTAEDWSRLVRARRQHDEAAIRALRQSGAVFKASPGTDAIVLEASQVAPGLRLRNGPATDQTCFTKRAYVTEFYRFYRYRPYW